MLDENTLRDIIHSAQDGIVVTETQGTDNPIIFANPAFEALTGYAEHEIIGQDCRFLQGPDADQPGVAELSAAIRQRRSTQVILKNYRKDGSPFWNELSVSPVTSSAGEQTLFVGIQKDVTERVELANRLGSANTRLKQINDRLEKENKVDALTGIYNRKVLDEEVSMLWRTAQRVGGNFALLYIDLDDFKHINDEHGHDAGDHCLAHVAKLLSMQFRRESDVVLRLGGEEFLIASFGADVYKAMRLAQQVVDRVAAHPCQVSGLRTPLPLQVSVGVAVMRPQPDSELQDLINEADEAMFRAKSAGKNRACLAGSVKLVWTD